jgi:hypothetical protein
MREAGHYTCNTAKQDYNMAGARWHDLPLGPGRLGDAQAMTERAKPEWGLAHYHLDLLACIIGCVRTLFV